MTYYKVDKWDKNNSKNKWEYYLHKYKPYPVDIIKI